MDPVNSLLKQVTNTHILPKMSEDAERLVRLETKLDVVLDNQTSFRALFEKHDDRLKHLENSKAGLLGIAGAIGAASSFLMDSIKHAVTR